MRLTLVLPKLLDAEPDALAAASAPALARLLSTASAPVIEAGGALAFACASLGIAKQDDWPAAPFLARAAGIDPDSRYWLCAAPLALELDRDRGRFAGIVSDLDIGESAGLLSGLRAHFASDGIEFVERGPGRWWVALTEAQRLETSAPSVALGASLTAHLPRGADAPRWRRWQSEMQMLLFEHPVNVSRENSGRMAVSYIWMWGGGVLREPSVAVPGSAVFADEPLVRDLARATRRDVAKVPESFASLSRAPPVTSALVWLDDALETRDLPSQLAAFDLNWAAPLERALDRREIHVTLVMGGWGRVLSFTPRATGAMKRLARRWSQPPHLSTVFRADANR